MSIIEKAIGKLQASSPFRNATGARRERLDRPAPAQTEAPSSSEAFTPKKSVETSLEALRAAGIVPQNEHSHRLTEQFRRVKWPLLESAAGRPSDAPANLIMVTSSVAEEGKTFTAFNLALSIAREKDFNVLLVDADVAKFHVSKLLGLDGTPGLTDLLMDLSLDPNDLLVGTNIPGLLVLPAGRHSNIAPELFASERMVEVVRFLGGNDPRRIVLFDSSPLLATNESQVLSRIVDQVLLVVRAESTSQPTVVDAIALLDRSKEIRCVLNQSSIGRKAEYYYGYGHGKHDNATE
jgi:exopolysaccharide/PEP-CTERM locus tyrosine autokinase